MTHPISSAALNAMSQALGSDNVSTDEALRALYSQDVWAKGLTADFVISPENTEQLSEAVKLAARDGIALNPRGGGMSYTKGFTPTQDNVGILDFTRMDKVLEINTDDMYVTVQAGCTWKTLNEALKPLGVRTPFWGPLSGLLSTIGGGLSQNNAFFGGSLYGPSSDSVTCLTVVLADGSIVRTGSAGTQGGKPFFRQYGPDLTGLFLSDAGTLGYKAEATFRLIPTPLAEGWASFDFEDRDEWADAQVEMGRLGLACELFSFDPKLTEIRMIRAGLAADVKSLKNVITQEKGGLLKGLKEGAKVAMAGRNFMQDAAYNVHLTVEGHSDAEVSAKLKTLKDIAARHNGKEIENSIPKIIRANPFTPLNNMLGPRGERWVPIHGIVPMSEGKDCLAEIEALLEQMKAELESFDIHVGYLLCTVSNNGFLIEPVFIWPEELFELHRRSVDASVIEKATVFAPNPEATACVGRARQGIMDIFSARKAAHFQIGRTYPYKENRESAAWAAIEHIKAALDPGGNINPGALGLG